MTDVTLLELRERNESHRFDVVWNGQVIVENVNDLMRETAAALHARGVRGLFAFTRHVHEVERWTEPPA